MAQRVITISTCDFHAAEGEEVEAVGSKYFTLEGRDRRLDLCEDHLAELEQTFEQLMATSTSSSGLNGHPQPTRRRASSPNAGGAAKAIRAWAAEHNIELKERGRIPAQVLAQFKAAQG